jgi:sulfur-carrier protein
MKVHIPSPLLSYTNDREEVTARGASVAEVLADLNAQFPGLRFRMIDEQDNIRPHMRIYVNGAVANGLNVALQANDEIHILQALSGG